MLKRRRLLAIGLLSLCVSASVVHAQSPAPPARLIGFMTDFDLKDDAVAIC